MACRIAFPAFISGSIAGTLYEYHSTPLDFGKRFAFHADAKISWSGVWAGFLFLLRTKQ